MPDRVYIVVLNWNGWRDTVACLDAALALDHAPTTIIVCDNGSTDDSLQRLRAWGATTRADWTFTERWSLESPPGNVGEVVLHANGANLGFAGGCNVGVRMAMARPDCAFVWLLNNDTVVDRSALTPLVARCKADQRIGICGSQIRYANRRDRVQSQGGRLNPWFCTTHLLHEGHTLDAERIDFVPGASMLVTRSYLKRVGVMSEEYFLYFEEIDWAERGKHMFTFAICPDSVVYHVGGASIGNPRDDSDRGLRADWYLLRGRLMFAKKFYRRFLPTVYSGMLFSIAKRLAHRDFRRALVACYALFNRPVSWLR